MNTKNITTQGVHHVGLTVPDLDQTLTFFVDVLNYNLLGKREEYPAAFISDGVTMITLWQAGELAVEFDRTRNIGLHHLAISIKDTNSLAELHQQLQNTTNVTIEFTPQLQGAGNNTHMMCNIPGGIRVEFIAPTA
jgi:catechol 2,3-dioxygenase-like lactoylglutathione lyase family enzyme